MSPEVYPAFVAVLFGAGLGLALFVPFVAVQYRRRGTLGLARVLIALAVLVSALAVIAYTLLPLPTVTPSLCASGGAGIQPLPGQVVRDVLHYGATGRSLLHNPAVQQAAFNVALFVPLGAFVRYFRGTRVLTATVLGLGVSLLIELTQLTGDWFSYPCAYRLFDVDDLLTNTTGALVGALMAPVLARVLGQQGRDDPETERPVTAWRRLLGMASDWATGQGIGLALSFAYTVAFVRSGVPSGTDRAWQAVLVSVVPAFVLLAVMLRTHRSVGEAVVRLRPRGTVRLPAVALRWLLGIGGYLLVSAASSGLAIALAVVSVVAVFATAGHRGLAYRLVGWHLVDDRDDGDADGRDPHVGGRARDHR